MKIKSQGVRGISDKLKALLIQNHDRKSLYFPTKSSLIIFLPIKVAFNTNIVLVKWNSPDRIQRTAYEIITGHI